MRVVGARRAFAGWFFRSGCDGVAIGESGAAGRANDIAFQVGADIRVLDGLLLIFLCVQRPLLNGGINLAQVIDTRIRLGNAARPQKAGYCNASQQSDDGDDDHDLDEREACRPRSVKLLGRRSSA